MSSNTIIKDFNIFKYASSSLLPGPVFLKIDKLRLQRVKKRFHNGIVVTITRRVHALDKTMLFHKITKSITGILCSTI